MPRVGYERLKDYRPVMYGGVKMVQAYCVKDRKMVDMKDPKEITLKNGRSATQGTCPTCGTKVTRIGGNAAK